MCSFWHQILPYVEQSSLYALGTPANPRISGVSWRNVSIVPEVAGVSVKVYLCPSDGGPLFSGTAPWPSMAGNLLLQTTPVTEEATSNYAANTMVFDPSINRSLVNAMPDGLSNTVTIGHMKRWCDADFTGFGTNGGAWNLWGQQQFNGGFGGGLRDMGVFGSSTYVNHPTVGYSILFPNLKTQLSGLDVWNATRQNEIGIWPARKDFRESSVIPFWTNPARGFCRPNAPTSTHDAVMICAVGDGSARTVSSGVTSATWYAACVPTDGAPLGSDW